MKKRILSWILCLVMLFNNALPVFAVDGATEPHVHGEECGENCTLGTSVTTDTSENPEPETTEPEADEPDTCTECGSTDCNGSCEDDDDNVDTDVCADCGKDPCECKCETCGDAKHDGECKTEEPTTAAPEKKYCDCGAELVEGETHVCPPCNTCGAAFEKEHECPPCSTCGAAYEANHTCPPCSICGKAYEKEHNCETCIKCGLVIHVVNGHDCKCTCDFVDNAHDISCHTHCGEGEHLITCSEFEGPKCCEWTVVGVGEVTHAETCIKNAVCEICGATGKHFKENCPECPLCKEFEGATEHIGEKCKFYCDTCSAIVSEGEAHVETCVKDKTCEVCGVLGKHFTADCPECPACKEVSDTHDFAKKCKFANPTVAAVYELIDDVHIEVEDDVIDVSEHNNKTYYICSSDSAQNIKVSHPTFIGIVGVSFNVNNDEYALVSTDGGAWFGDGKAHVTVAANTPNGTEIIISAYRSSITIKVIDELITKKPENNITTSVGDTEISIGGNIQDGVKVEASVVETYHTSVLEYVESAEEILFAYDITPVDADGNPWQPQDGEPVTITLDVAAEDGKYIGILHEHDGVLEKIGNYLVEYGKITFTVDNFSAFYGYIVDFEYNGLKYSLIRGNEVLLSKLLEALNIERDVTEVTDISFSDDSLFEVRQEYGEWVLKSVNAFDENTYMCITFGDDTIEIKLTDTILFYYLDGSNWCMDTFKGTITRNDATSGAPAPTGEVVINSEAITGADLAEKNNIRHDVTIYARPGMAIRFNRFSAFSNCTALNDNKVSKDGLWRWVWGKDTDPNGDTTGYNYVVISDSISGVKETEFTIGIGNAGEYENDVPYVPCDIKIVIVPGTEILPNNTDNQPMLMKDAINIYPELKDKYEIKELPVTLYDYDGKAFNEYYQSKGEPYFAFSGISKGVSSNITGKPWTGNGEVNGGGAVIMGILNDSLDNESKLPTIRGGQNVDLFSSTEEYDGKKLKTVYEDVKFEFIYEKSTGYYTYSSNLNHAQLNDDETKIQLYREAMGTTPASLLNRAHENYAAGGFYPFSDITTAIKESTVKTDGNYWHEWWPTWESRLNSGYIKEAAPYGADPVISTADTATVDMHNGLQVSAQFYLPADKKAADGSDIIYHFTGDDDLWVFIDDQLVLDIGGGHYPASGEINFTQGTVTVEGSYYTVTFDENGKCTATPSPEGQTSYTRTGLNFAGDQMHSLKIFYLERHAGVSNCRMHFNIPIIPENSVTISKELVSEDGQPLSVTPDIEYVFEVYTKELESDSFVQLMSASNSNEGTDIVDGVFKIKPGQTAVFEGFERFTKVYLKELTPSTEYIHTKSTVSTNYGEDVPYIYGNATHIDKLAPEITTDQGIVFDFTNYMKTQPLTINKFVNGGANALVDANQKFTFNLAFTQDCQEISSIATEGNVTSITVTDGESENADLFYPSGTFTLQQGQSVTIPRVPVNMTYTLSETDTDTNTDDHATFDKPQFKVNNTDPIVKSFKADGVSEADYLVNGTIEDKINTVTVTNLQRFALRITKNITGNVNPDQSFIFDIKGNDSHVSDIENTVVIPYEKFVNGSASVLITGLPVGKYEVTEDSEWSWRYGIEDGDTITKVSDKPTVNTIEPNVPFTNKRTNPYWLDGEAWCKNVFGKDVDWVNKTNPMGDVKRPEDDE